MDYFVTDTGNDSNGGTNKTTDAWLTLQHALDTVTSGNNINVSGDRTISTMISADTNAGTFEAPIIVQGFETTERDGGKPTYTANGIIYLLNINKAYYVVKDMILKGGTNSPALSNANGEYTIWCNCEINGNNESKYAIYALNGSSSSVCGCKLEDYDTYGIYGSNGNLHVYDNYISDGYIGITISTSSDVSTIMNNIFTEHSNNCIKLDTNSQQVEIMHNTFVGKEDASSSAIFIYGGCTNNNIRFNLFYDFDSVGAGPEYFYAINSVDDIVNTIDINYNAYYNAENRNVTASPNDIVLTEDPFTDVDNADYSLNNTVGGGANCKNIEMNIGSTTSYLYIGAVSPESGGGSSEHSYGCA